MADERIRKIGELEVRIDRRSCIGSGNCTDLAPELFRLDDSMVVTFAEGAEAVEAATVIDACRSCPVFALTVVGPGGEELVP